MITEDPPLFEKVENGTRVCCLLAESVRTKFVEA